MFRPFLSFLYSNMLLSAWSIHSHIEYSVMLRPFQLFLCSNIQSYDSLIDSLTYWIFGPCFGHSDYPFTLIFNSISAWSTCLHIKYSVMLRPFRLFLYSKILPCIRLIHTLAHWIFSHVSAIPIIPACKYSILRQLDWFTHILDIHSSLGHSDYSNILSCVSLMYTLAHWIFSHVSAIPIIPVFQYSIRCQANPYTHTLNIQSFVGYSDHSGILILYPVSG
jgi:hypothetical protein